jgi:hypothetical protein
VWTTVGGIAGLASAIIALFTLIYVFGRKMGQLATKDEISVIRGELNQLRPRIEDLCDFRKVTQDTILTRFFAEAKLAASNPFTTIAEYLNSEEGKKLRDFLSEEGVSLEDKIIKAIAWIGIDELQDITGEEDMIKAVGKIVLYIEKHSS